MQLGQEVAGRWTQKAQYSWLVVLPVLFVFVAPFVFRPFGSFFPRMIVGQTKVRRACDERRQQSRQDIAHEKDFNPILDTRYGHKISKRSHLSLTTIRLVHNNIEFGLFTTTLKLSVNLEQ